MEIDLNADLGEGYGPWRMGDDEAMMSLISSANIACGYHAGDPLIMDRTVRMAIERGVDIGAHVGFPDKQGFGRRFMQVDMDDLAAMIKYQLGALAGIARAHGRRMTHMSFHGALGNRTAADPAWATPLLKAIAAFDPNLIISTSPSRAIERAAAELGLPVGVSFLADRAYDDQGLLVSRSQPGAVIHDEEQVLVRVRRLLTEGTIVTHSGNVLPLQPRSILVHGDTPGAVATTQRLRAEIESLGGHIVPISQQLGFSTAL